MNLQTRIRSFAMRRFSSPTYLDKARSKARRQRERSGHPPTVLYFHQVDDPYSHLAVQKLDALQDRYQVDFETYLVSAPGAAYQGSATQFSHWGWRDAAAVAPNYGVMFTPALEEPSADNVLNAIEEIARHLNTPDFADNAFRVGQKLWSGEQIANSKNSGNAESALDQGNALRQRLGHYQGAMFYFEGEWFWGIDRIRSLEERLIAEGFTKDGDALCVPEPAPATTHRNAGDVTLEYFPSLRSPYTAIGHQRVLDLIDRTGVTVILKPVMPMMMRGIPAPREKQRYIITDSGREGRAHGQPFGKIVDPFGEPVKRAFALYAAIAEEQGMNFITTYLKAAWFDGVDITTTNGLKQVVSAAGLDWDYLHQAMQTTDWEAKLDSNLSELQTAGLWGVPSFRVSGGNRNEPFACWGQDRIWRVEDEIATRVNT